MYSLGKDMLDNNITMLRTNERMAEYDLVTMNFEHNLYKVND